MRQEVLGTSWTSSEACVSEVATIATSVANILLLAVCTAESQIDQLMPDQSQAISSIQQIRLCAQFSQDAQLTSRQHCTAVTCLQSRAL